MWPRFWRRSKPGESGSVRLSADHSNPETPLPTRRATDETERAAEMGNSTIACNVPRPHGIAPRREATVIGLRESGLNTGTPAVGAVVKPLVVGLFWKRAQSTNKIRDECQQPRHRDGEERDGEQRRRLRYPRLDGRHERGKESEARLTEEWKQIERGKLGTDHTQHRAKVSCPSIGGECFQKALSLTERRNGACENLPRTQRRTTTRTLRTPGGEALGRAGSEGRTPRRML